MQNDLEKSIFDVTSKSSVSVPTLLYHDMKEHVLIMSDLGSLPSILDHFSAIVGGLSTLLNPAVQLNQAGSVILDSIGEEEKELESFYLQLGTQFGHFFALIHSRNTLDVIQRRFGSDSKFPSDPSIEEAVVGWTITQMQNRLNLFPSISAEFSPKADQLVERALADARRQTVEAERAFIHGDAWPSAMLVDPAMQKNSPLLSVGFIDWEYAKIGRGISSDFAVVSAYFALMEIAAAFVSETKISIASNNIPMYLHKFRNAMVLKYREASCEEDALWQQNLGDGDIPDVLDPRTLVFRSTMIAHGTEIIRLTLTRRWKCGHTQCSMDSSELDNEKRHCELLQRMIRYGLWYLCHAEDSLSEFCSRKNWEKIIAGHGNGYWLLDLFL